MMTHCHSRTCAHFIIICELVVCLVPTAIYTLQDGQDVVTRCYCNEAACVRTGYMCKTSLGACFAQRSPGGHRIRYACAHWLDDDADRRLCLTSADSDADYVIRRRVTSSHADVVTWTELACCSTDMCNYYYFRSQQVVATVDVHSTNASTDPQQQLQQQDDDVTSSSSSSSLCLHTVVMVTVPLCVVVLVTFTAVVALYAFSARRQRRMTSSPAAAFPLPVATECRCGGADRLVRCGGCRPHLPLTVTDDCHKSVEQQQHLLTSPDSRYNDGRRLAVVAPTSSSLHDDRPLQPASNYSESTLLLVARDAWTS